MKFLKDKYLYEYLEEKYHFYNNSEYIKTDPIQIPHLFDKKEDIEISAFLTSTIAWGQRKTIIKNSLQLINLMGNNPYEFIQNFEEKDLKVFNSFIHRTFNGTDCVCFLKSLQNIYINYGSLETIFVKGYEQNNSFEEALIYVRNIFFQIEHEYRTEKHFSNITKGSAAKRLNMFLRWMVRNDNCGVDFGIWKKISSSSLFIPLDVHVGNTARKLGLLNRKQNDWKAVVELTNKLKTFDSKDPVKYDFALFGIGAFEKF